MPSFNLNNINYCNYKNTNIVEIYVGNTSAWQCNSTTFIVNAPDNNSTTTVKIKHNGTNNSYTITRLLINGNPQDLPTSTRDDIPTEYTVTDGSFIRIYGDFSLDGTTAKLTNINIQKNVQMYYLFNNCINLTEAPELPPSRYYSGVFRSCRSLKKATKIPEGTIGAHQMFYYCKSLEETPPLPNTLQDCGIMFGNCSKLTVAPEIPDDCTNCEKMFYFCTSLTTLPQKNIDLMANTPTNLNCASCYYGCTHINCINTNWQTNGLPEIITYADIPAAWKDINQQTLNLEAEDDYWN